MLGAGNGMLMVTGKRNGSGCRIASGVKQKRVRGNLMDRFIREIAITEIDGVSIGHAQDNEAKDRRKRIVYTLNGRTGRLRHQRGDPKRREKRRLQTA